MGRILFHKYEVLRPVGEGGVAKVYLARDRNLERLVVAKESREEFLLPEVTLLKELRHPGLPEIYDCFREDESSFLVMEYIEGMSLRQYLDRHGRVPEQQAVRWCLELCDILGYLHDRHPAVIYRDLKPENIMVCQDGSLKLIDFGGAIRCAFGGGREELCIGTVGYCPGEQWRETAGEVSWDIYALGAVLHEMLTGANPTRPPRERRPVREYDRSLSRTLDKIIGISTAKEPSKRYSSMKQFAQALQKRNAVLKEEGLLRFPVAAGRWLRIMLMAFMGGYTASCFLCPLMRGVPETHIPFPYLEKPLLFLALTLLLYLFLFGYLSEYKSKKGCLRRHEKNIWLTAKKFSGLMALFLFLSGTVIPAIPGGKALFCGILPQSALAAERRADEEELWVEMRDDQGRKMLLKDDAVYQAENKVRFELPADRLPGQKLALQFVAVGEDGTFYNSRIFYIRAKGED